VPVGAERLGNPLADLLLPTSGLDAVAVECLDRTGRPVLTYGDLDEQSAALVRVLRRHGVDVADRVVVVAAKSPEVLLLHLACARMGAVFVPLNPDYPDAELATLIDDAEPSLLLLDPSRAALAGRREHLTLAADGTGTLTDAAAQMNASGDDGHDRSVGSVRNATVALSPDAPAAMLYTSGTTGRPKAAVLSHANLVANASTLTQAWGFTADDALLHVLPLFHTHGLFVAAHCALASRSRLLLRTRFDTAQTCADLRAATVFMGVPTHYTRLLTDPAFDRSTTQHLRLMTSGSAPMSVETHDAVRERTGHTILERYGMTETCMLTSNPLSGQRRIGTVGPALPGVGVRVVGHDDQPLPSGEVGDVQVRGANVFDGYWQRPELRATEFTRDGWFRTGDLGVLSDDGYLELVGRAKDLIITGGMNVYPKEVEQVIDELPGVAESAVVGIPDHDFGEAVVAVIVALPDAALDPAAVRTALREHLAPYKVPKQVRLADQLPRNTMGKVQKTTLRQWFT
jgi:malonyl-CoA/methylmalonyl-CoA synthetase